MTAWRRTAAVRRQVAALVVATAITLLTVLAGMPGTADAVAYRYWSYWSWDGDSWSYSNTGPPARVHDGDVIGWRFATQPDSSSAVAPRGGGKTLCSDGVSVFIDYGSSTDAPPDEQPPSARAFCADDDDSDNGYRATEEHATIRVRSDGLVCGIDSYPDEECGQKVSTKPSASASPRRTAEPDDPPRGRDGKNDGGTARHPTTGSATTSAQPPGSATPAASSTAQTTSPDTAPDGEEGTPSPTTTFALTENAPNQGVGDEGGVPVGPIVGGVAIAALSGAAVWQHRRSTR